MSYEFTMAAFEAAKASGDVAAIIAAAEALAAASAPPKPARKARKAASDVPAWFEAVAKGKNRAQFSLVVEFVDGVITRANAWQDPGKPIAVGRALRVACEFYRARSRRMGGSFDCAVPAIASVQLVDGDAFDAALCTRLTEAMRAARSYQPQAIATEADRIATTEREVASWRRILAERDCEHARRTEEAARLWMREEGNAREEAEERLRHVDAMLSMDIRSAERALAAAESRLAATSAEPDGCQATERFVARLEHEPEAERAERAAARDAWDEAQAAEADELAAIEAEPCEPAYPDADDEPGPVCTGAPDMVATSPDPDMVAARPCNGAPKRRPRARKPTDSERLDAERHAIEAMPLPASQAQWRALSSRMRAWKREMERRAGRQGTFGLSVGPERRRQIRIERYASLYVYNGASRLSYVGMIAFQRRQYVARIQPHGRVADARQFAEASRREGPVPLPDIGRPYRLCGGAPCAIAPIEPGSEPGSELLARSSQPGADGRARRLGPARHPSVAAASPAPAIGARSANAARSASSGCSSLAAPTLRPDRGSPLVALAGQSAPLSECRYRPRRTHAGSASVAGKRLAQTDTLRTSGAPDPGIRSRSPPPAMVVLSIPWLARYPVATSIVIEQRVRSPP